MKAAAAAVAEWIIALAMRDRRTRALLLAPGGEALRWRVGRLRAWRAANRARRQVPAYTRHLDIHGATGARRLGELPETSKACYVAPNRLEALCRHGRLPRRGVVLDESSGSSGTPTSWARGPAERRATARLLRMTFVRGLSEAPVVVLNAFSLGAWATGLNVTMALSSVCRIKSTGPDRDKIIHTIRELGPDYAYVVLGYPPFLKDLADDPRLDLADYDVTAGFGGEGLSENMRSYLLRSYRQVKGSYGASDLEINLAAETDLTIALRRELAVNTGLRDELLAHTDAPLPMIFQYNPLDYVIETNVAGELVVTVCRAANLSPRIRYNIGDVGHVARMPELRRVLHRHGAAHVLDGAPLDLPVLFHYGRSDASVDFYGAVVTPDELRDALYAVPALADRMREFRLISWEDDQATTRLLFAVELQPGHDPTGDEASLGVAVVAHLSAHNADFANACRIAADGAQPRLRLFAAGTGPFAQESALKYRYISRIDTATARSLDLDREMA
ncbi:phenylacetate--CoA ligase family protein [soil metagenome]